MRRFASVQAGDLEHVFRDHNDAAEAQWQKQLEDRQVEAQGRRRQHRGCAGPNENVLRPMQHGGRADMRYGDALGSSRGARSVDDIGEILRRGAAAERFGALAFELLPIRIELQDLRSRGKPLRETLLRQHETRRRIRDHVGETLCRIVWIERQIGAARLQHAEQCDHHLQRAFDAKADDRLWPDAETDETTRQPARPRVQFAIGESVFAEDRGHGVGRALRLRLEQLVDAQVMRKLRRCVVPIDQQPPTFGPAQHRQRSDASARIGDNRFQQIAIMIRHARDRRPLEQSGRIFDRCAQCALALGDFQCEIEFRRSAVRRKTLDPQAGQGKRPRRRILRDEHRLKQRTAAHVARRAQLLHQTFERKILMLLRAQRRLAHPLQKRDEARIAREVRAQNQRVDEKADQPLELHPSPIGRRRADANVALPAVARQQKLKRREQYHEQRRALLPSEALQPIRERRRDHEAMHAAGGILNRRTRMICR